MYEPLKCVQAHGIKKQSKRGAIRFSSLVNSASMLLGKQGTEDMTNIAKFAQRPVNSHNFE